MVNSCKKEELQQEGGEPYFSFLKNGNEFTYKKYTITNSYFEGKSDTTRVESFKVKVSELLTSGNLFAVNNNFPLINIRLFYRNSSMFGVSPTDSIISKHSEMDGIYVQGFKDRTNAFPPSSRVYTESKNYNNKSIDVYHIGFSDGSDPAHYGEIVLSKDFGVVSAKYITDPHMPPISQIEAYELISTNF